jgi:hypothetical protein
MLGLRRKAKSMTYNSQQQAFQLWILVPGECISRADTEFHVAPESELTLATLASHNISGFVSLELHHDHRHGEVV